MEKSYQRISFAALCSLLAAVLFARIQVYADLAPIPPEEPQGFPVWPLILIGAVVIIALILFFKYRK